VHIDRQPKSNTSDLMYWMNTGIKIYKRVISTKHLLLICRTTLTMIVIILIMINAILIHDLLFLPISTIESGVS